MLLNYLPAIVFLVIGWCISRMTSPEASLIEQDISISKSFISSHGALRPQHHRHHHNHHHHHHHHHHHGRRHHRSRRQACQFPESLLTFLDESDVLPPLDVSSIDMESMEFEEVESTDIRPSKSSAGQQSEVDGTETGSKSSQSKSETAGDVLSETLMSDSRERRGKSRSKGHHSVADNLNYGNDQHEDGGGDGMRGKSRRAKNKNKSRLRRDLNAETEITKSLAEERKVQIRDWRGDIRRQFQSFGKSLTIERSLISEFKDGEVSKYHCISKVKEGEDGGFGDGTKHTYVVEIEEYRNEQVSPARKFFTCLTIIERSSEIIQLAFSSDNSAESTKDVCNSHLVLDNWLYVDKMGIAKAKKECPVKGGFEMKMYNSVGREALCDAYIRETRFESGCSDPDPTDFSFIYRWPRCVPSAVSMKPTQELTCVASWNQSTFQYVVLRSPIYSKDSDINSYSASKNQLPSFLYPHLHSKDVHEPALRKSMSVSGNEKFMIYMFRFPSIDLVNDNSEHFGKRKKFQAILYSNLVTIPGFEFQSTTYTDEVYVRMSSNRDERTFLCEDDYEACATVSPPCTPLFKVTCPKTCGLCNGDLSFNSSLVRTTKSSRKTTPQFCNFPSFFNGRWREIATQKENNFTSDEWHSRFEFLNVTEDFLERSIGTDSHLLKCIQWTDEVDPIQKFSDSIPSTLPFYQIMTVGRHDNGCSPRYTCLKIFPLSQRSIIVAFSKDIPWPLVTSSQLETSPNDLPIDCEAAQKTAFNFYPKENFRLFTRRESSHDDIPYPDAHSKLTDSEKIEAFNKFMNLFIDDDSMKMTFSDGVRCSGALTMENGTSDVRTQLKVKLNSCTQLQGFEGNGKSDISISSKLTTVELHRRLIRHKYFLSNISPPHLKLLKSRKLKFIDSFLVPKFGENIRSLVATLRIDKSSSTDEGSNLFMVTAASDESKGLFVPYCWLMRNVDVERLKQSDDISQSSLPFTGPIFLFSGKGCSNAMEDYILATDPEYVRLYRFSPPSYRPTKQDQLRFPGEDFSNRSLAIIEYVPKLLTTNEPTTIEVQTTTTSQKGEHSRTEEALFPPVYGTVEEMPKNISSENKVRTPKSAKDFLVMIVARLILAIVDFLTLIRSFF